MIVIASWPARILHLVDKSTTIDSPINSLTGSVSMLFQLTRKWL
jgi:hypothetical protein